MRAVCERGHAAVVVCESTDDVDSAATLLKRELSGVPVRRAPSKVRWHRSATFVEAMRLFNDYLIYFDDRFAGKNSSRLRRFEKHLHPTLCGIAKHVFLVA